MGSPAALERPLYFVLYMILLWFNLANSGYTIDEVRTTAASAINHPERANSVSGTVWLDANGNGQNEESEPGLANVVLRLYDSQGQLIASAATDGQGAYQLLNLANGSYQLRINIDTLPPAAGAPSYDPDGILNHKTPLNLYGDDMLQQVDFGYMTSAITPEPSPIVATSTITIGPTAAVTPFPINHTATPNHTSTPHPTSTVSAPTPTARPLPTITVWIVTATPAPKAPEPTATPDLLQGRGIRHLYLPIAYKQ